MNDSSVRPRIRLAIAAVPFSANLGDGVIHEVMRRILLGNTAVASITTLDIAGRTRYVGLDTTERSRRQRGLKLINKLPHMLRPWSVLAYTTLKYLRSYRRHYAETLASVDHLIIGGGHLFCDLDLNFPTKLFFLYQDIRRFKVPFSIYAVGAGDNWSPLGRYLFRNILRSPLLKGVSARDDYTGAILARELRYAGSRLSVSTVWDPAVATALVYAAKQSHRVVGGQSTHIGLNVADIALLAKAGDSSTGIADGLSFFSDLLHHLRAAGYQVTLFTNGAEEDEHFLDSVASFNGNSCRRASRPLTPEELVDLIQTFDVVISHRLHASIICFSYGIPSIGLSWDRKLLAFFQRTARTTFLVEPEESETPGLAARIVALVATASQTVVRNKDQAAAEASQQLQAFVSDAASSAVPARQSRTDSGTA